PVRKDLISQLGYILQAHLAQEKAAYNQVAKNAEEPYARRVLRRCTLGEGYAVQHLFLLYFGAIHKIATEPAVALHIQPDQPSTDLSEKISAFEAQPVVDKLRNARLSSAAASLVSRDDEIAE